VLTAVGVAPLSTSFAQDRSCPCKPRTEPSAFGEKRQKTGEGVDFEWFSDADRSEKEPGRYCYERVVTNHHATAPLRFDWPVGRLESDALAPKGGQARSCVFYGEHTTREGPLHYGRGADKTHTKVYEAQNEPKPGPLTTVAQVDGFVQGKNYPAKIALTSSVTQAGSRFIYLYKLQLIDPGSDVVVQWLSAETPEVRSELAKMGRSVFLSLSWKDKGLIEVKTESDYGPRVLDRGVSIFGPQNTFLLKAGAAAYVPAKQ
jgi:hypothetical protein